MSPFIRYLSIALAAIWAVLVLSLVGIAVYTVITGIPLIALVPTCVCLGLAAFIFCCMRKWEW